MKKFTFPLILAGALALAACGSNQASAEEQEVLAGEITEIENASEAIEESVEAIDSTLADLDQALDSLDVLFPEDQ